MTAKLTVAMAGCHIIMLSLGGWLVVTGSGATRVGWLVVCLVSAAGLGLMAWSRGDDPGQHDG